MVLEKRGKMVTGNTGNEALSDLVDEGPSVCGL